MSQTTLDQNTTPEGAAEPAKARPSRSRRSSSRQKTQAAPAPEQTQEAVASALAPAAETKAEPAALHAEPPAAAPSSAAAQAPQPAEGQRRSGSHRSRGRGGRDNRKATPQLVLPAGAQQDESDTAGAGEQPKATETPAAAQQQPAPEQPSAQEAPAATAEPRIVPVTTETTAPVAVAEPPAAPAPRRYRFERRPTGAPAAPATRPERLSGVAAATAAPVAETSVPVAAPTPVPSEPAIGAPERTEQPDETRWQANLAEVEPADVARSAANAEVPAETAAAPARGADTAVDDIIAALGLRNGATPEAGAVESAAEGEAETEGEAGHEAAAEGETQGTGRRRRRRRRGGAHNGAAQDEAEDEHAAPAAPAAWPIATPPAEAPEAERASANGFEPYYPYSPTEQPYLPYGRPAARERDRERAQAQPSWETASAQEGTRGTTSPFGAPEPSFARGFGPQPRGVAQPLRESYPRTVRPERGMDIPPMSSNQLASVVSHAIQQQTDRLLSELRHQAHAPSMTVQFPAFPSTERVGVFVDVANLLYSARNLRMQIDFGRLLDFLRSNRRLIRAHAYAPTNPDPNADQSFLSAVKGLGYRITTKNYKTFASGAKKADMDLDLCMDIVRMVDAKAVDTVVLVSGDSDFLPLLEYCSDRGVRVEVAAFDDSAAMILRQSCDLFINLSAVEEIRY